MIDLGLLLSRAAGFLLVFTFGIQKIGWYVTAFHAGKPLSSIGLAPLIAHVGFPLPVILALWITLNESIGAFFVGFGFLTRFAAASLALGMIGALYTSVRLGEDWLRAALYLIVFLSLTFTSAGRFSIDHLLKNRAALPKAPSCVTVAEHSYKKSAPRFSGALLFPQAIALFNLNKLRIAGADHSL